MGNQDQDKLLRSWKEISAHLGVDERTCARWEQRFGMPVRRAAEGAGRSHVFAYADELDDWFRETFPPTVTNSGNGAEMLPRKTRAAVPRHPVKATVLGGFLLAAAVLFLQFHRGGLDFKRKGQQPADFHLHGSLLIITDEAGKEVWRNDIHIDGLLSEDEYRNYFQTVKKNSVELGQALPLILIKDIDKDGRLETLFSVRRTSDSVGEGIVICYDDGGNERWRFRAGRTMTYGGVGRSADYRIHGVALHDTNGDGRLEIFVIGYHYPWELCQLAALDDKGNLMGEFWNSGQLKDIAFADIDGDGHEELIAGGVNNEYGGGCLVVLDPRDIRGASPQSAAKYSFENVEEGSEKYYLDLPRSDVSRAGGAVVAGIDDIEGTAGVGLWIRSHMGLVFEIGPGMRCLDVRPENGFITKHAEYKAAGKITSALNDTYCDALRRGIRYWNGDAWVFVPTMNLKRRASDKLPAEVKIPIVRYWDRSSLIKLPPRGGGRSLRRSS